MERAAEIERISRELAILQERYALYGRMARILRGMCMVLAPLALVGACLLAVRIFFVDTLYGVFFVAALLLIVATTQWLIVSSNLRWIDLASQQFRGIYYPGFFDPDRERPRFRSDAEVIEQQIAERMDRLDALRDSR